MSAEVLFCLSRSNCSTISHDIVEKETNSIGRLKQKLQIQFGILFLVPGRSNETNISMYFNIFNLITPFFLSSNHTNVLTSKLSGFEIVY